MRGSALSLSFLVLLTACNRQVAGGSTDGATVFAAACARCHGDTGRPPPQMTAQHGVRDLTADEFRARRTLPLIEEQVRRGSANGRMPAFTGSLTDRMSDGPPAGRGRVRAKTGTLMSVRSLAGTATLPDGAVVAFVLMADRIADPMSDIASRRLDSAAVALGACRCSS